MSYGQYNESRGGQYGSYPGGSSGGGGGMGYGGGGGYGSTSQQLQQQGLGGGGAGYEQQQQLQQGQQQGGGYGGYQQQQDLEIIAEKVHFAGLMPAHLGDRASRLTSSLSVIAVPQSSATQYQWEGDQGQVGGTLRGWATEGVGINGRKHIKANVSNDVLRFNLWQMEGFQKNRRGKPLATGILPLAELSRVNDFSNAVAIDRFVDLYPSPHLFEGTPAMTDHPIAFVHVMVRRRLPLPSFAAMATGKQRQAMGAGTGAGAAGYGGQQQQFMGGQQQQIPQQQIPQQQLAGGGQPFQTQQAAGQQPIQGLGTSSQAPASYSKQQEFASAGGMGSQYGNPSANIPSTQQSYQRAL